MNTTPNKKITVNDLPVVINPAIMPEPELSYAGFIITLIGIIIALVGIVTIITGPDVIQYYEDEGMSFKQIIQAFPGPIATAGSLIFYFGNKCRNDFSENEIMDSYIKEKLDLRSEDVPDGKEISIEIPEGENKYHIKLVDIESRN